MREAFLCRRFRWQSFDDPQQACFLLCDKSLLMLTRCMDCNVHLIHLHELEYIDFHECLASTRFSLMRLHASMRCSTFCYVDSRAQSLGFTRTMGDALSRVMTWYDRHLEARGHSPVMIALLQATQHHLRITSFVTLCRFLQACEVRALRATRITMVMLERSSKAQRFPCASQGRPTHPDFIAALMPPQYGAHPPLFPPPPQKASPARPRAQGDGSTSASSATLLPKLT